MQFYRRDLVLLAASALFTMAGAMYLGIAAIGIGAALFFGMKAIAVRRQQAIDRQVGEGLCAECGQPIVGGACPECDERGGSGRGAGGTRVDGGPSAGPGTPPDATPAATASPATSTAPAAAPDDGGGRRRPDPGP